MCEWDRRPESITGAQSPRLAPSTQDAPTDHLMARNSAWWRYNTIRKDTRCQANEHKLLLTITGLALNEFCQARLQPGRAGLGVSTLLCSRCHVMASERQWVSSGNDLCTWCMFVTNQTFIWPWLLLRR